MRKQHSFARAARGGSRTALFGWICAGCKEERSAEYWRYSSERRRRSRAKDARRANGDYFHGVLGFAAAFSALGLLVLMTMGGGCGGTMNTGTAVKPVNNKPAADGSCPSGQSLCGTGIFAICADLETDPNHCGACDRVCSAGIACQAGVCQQTLCTGTTIPLSGKAAISSTSTSTATSTSTSTSDSSGLVAPYWAGFTPDQTLADVNGDGLLDLIGGNTYFPGCMDCVAPDPNEFHVSLGQPGGTFAPPATYRASAAVSEIFVTDVNGDGLADLYVVSSTFANSAVAPYHVELWLGQTDGRLVRSAGAGLRADGMATSGYEIAVGDLSGDGWPDLVMSTADSNLEDPPQISVYLSDATGALHLSQTFVAWAGRSLIRDWNGDGSPDLVLLSGTIQILYNHGDGTFEQPLDCGLAVGAGGWGTQAIVVEDFNRDGWWDLAFAGWPTENVEVILGRGGCAFTPISFYDVPTSSIQFLRAADMNGDGILDLVSVGQVTGPDPRDPNGFATVITDNLLGVLLGNPDGSFRPAGPAVSLGPDWVSDVTLGEVNGDQRPDIVIATANDQGGQTSVLGNSCQ